MTKKYKLERLKGFNVFNKCFLVGNKIGTKKLFVNFVVGPSDVLFFGVGISKKKAKKAVVRNRIKRLLRQSVYELNLELMIPDTLIKIIFYWNEAPAHPSLINLAEIKQEMRAVFNRISKNL